MKKNIFGHSLPYTAHHTPTHANPLAGSMEGKYPIVLDGGKTIIFISDKSKEAETILRYEMRKVR
jgi:hypothetical protein